MSKTRVFLDNNVILEAFRTESWKVICDKYSIETVEKCVEETLTGNPEAEYYNKIKPIILNNGLSARHKVNKKDIIKLILSHPECQGLDDGELHLFAWLNSQEILSNVFVLISTADKAALRVAHILGWNKYVISLEDLLKKAGGNKTQLDVIRPHFRNAWLSKIKMNILMDIV